MTHSKFVRSNTIIRISRLYLHVYNHERTRLKLNGLSPVEFRTQA
ncbi:IS3 family transposase [Photorhabdus africana]